MKYICILLILFCYIDFLYAQNYQHLYPTHTTKIYFPDVDVSSNFKSNQNIIKSIEKKEKALLNIFETQKEYFELEKVSNIRDSEIIFFRKYVKNDSLEAPYCYQNGINFTNFSFEQIATLDNQGRDSTTITKFFNMSDEQNEKVYRFIEFDILIRKFYFPLRIILEPKNYLFKNTSKKYFLNSFIHSKNPRNQPIADTITHFINNIFCGFQEEIEEINGNVNIKYDIKYFPNYRYKNRKKETQKNNDIEIVGEMFEKEKNIYILQFSFIGKEIELIDALGEKINTSIEFNIEDFKNKKFSFLQYNLLKIFNNFLLYN